MHHKRRKFPFRALYHRFFTFHQIQHIHASARLMLHLPVKPVPPRLNELPLVQPGAFLADALFLVNHLHAVDKILLHPFRIAVELNVLHAVRKLVFWAYAASRVLDVLTLRPEVDARNIAVIGHSRLGKATLLCGAQDTRIRFTCANDAGCGGDALEQTKHPGAEDYAAMARSFPYWFCGNRSRYIDHPEERPYDQHFLLGAIAPRFAAVSSASLDRWADPYSQQLCCAAASPAWKLHGLRGFVGTESPAAVGAAYPEGHVAYHLRGGLHYLSRQDWLFYMDFVRRHKGETV